MNLLRLCAGAACLAMLPLVSISSLRADSIEKKGGEDSLVIASAPELAVDDTPGVRQWGYSFFHDGPDFGGLGLIPGSFLFGGNTSYDFNGSQKVTAISAITDPGQSTLPLDDPRTVVVTFTLPDTANGHAYGLGHALDGKQDDNDAAIATTPEPPAGFLFLCSGLALIALSRNYAHNGHAARGRWRKVSDPV